MSIFADILGTVFERRYRAPGPQDDISKPLEELTARLLGSLGEVSGMAVARQILDRYSRFDDAGKIAFFTHLRRDLDVDPAKLRAALDTYEAAPDKASYTRFMEAAEPPRQELARRLNQVPGATRQLVAMRHDLLRLAKANPDLALIDFDLRHLLQSWFNRGFLVLRPITWESPANILEKIIAYEAVHAIDSWDDLRRRLHPVDRRLFAFFHPSMADEPLIFVEVALTKGIPGSIQNLLAEDRAPMAAADADTAVFYSISNCQQGLASISFGNSLIKQVAADLSADLRGLTTFVTLSPIPGLAAWAKQEGLEMPVNAPEAMRQMAAHYLLHAKGRGGLPFDPVARFHLGNGAKVHAVHAEADASDKGRAQSGGTMVNYLYDLNAVAQNHERYATTNAVLATAEVTKIAGASAPSQV